MTTEEQFYIVPTETHNELVKKAYQHRGFDASECEAAAKFSAYATTHGIRTHNALKALHLDDLFGSKAEVVSRPLKYLRKKTVLNHPKYGTASLSLDRQPPMKQWIAVLN